MKLKTQVGIGGIRTGAPVISTGSAANPTPPPTPFDHGNRASAHPPEWWWCTGCGRWVKRCAQHRSQAPPHIPQGDDDTVSQDTVGTPATPTHLILGVMDKLSAFSQEMQASWMHLIKDQQCSFGLRCKWGRDEVCVVCGAHRD